MATRLGRDLASAGVIVVSGMALGIDSCAHSGALDAGGATVAVLGGGVEVPSPASMGRLYEQLVERGLLLSELPPGTTPRRWTFPARNRIMAALSGMTVVVEARRRSGSLITATLAADIGREVGAVPGLVGTSCADGTNGLLRDGAHVVRDAADVLDSLLGVGGRARDAAETHLPELEAELADVLEQVDRGAGSGDDVAMACEIAPEEAAIALSRLELRGLVTSDSTGRYRLARRH